MVFAGLLQQFTGGGESFHDSEFCAAESDSGAAVFEVLDTPVEVENKAGSNRATGAADGGRWRSIR